ncbi:MAG: phospholipid carrier-dependent glycosyltransferase [Ardenticatenaceae bacterium]|nr:phospholipid carrier-dependent glycosyltransferase [Ardenticatenaceae bacterium]
MMHRLSTLDKRLLNSLLVFFVFVAALLPRWGEGASRPNVWYERSYVFSFAVRDGDWASTFQRYHPGVTFMWLASAGIQTYLQREGFLTEEQVLVHEPVAEEAINGLVAAALLPVTLTIAAGIVLAAWWLRALAGPKVAVVAGLLLAFDPLHLANSKVAHLDGLLAVFMLLAALALVRYVCGHGRLFLGLSGGLAGLSLLTKTSSVFLIPYALLLLGWPLVWAWWRDGRWPSGQQVGRALLDFGLWLVVAVVVIFVCFPALWVEPAYVLGEMWGNLTRHATNVHKNPVFFAGQVWLDDDPGFPFYALVMAFKLTVVSLVGLVLGLVLVGKRPSSSARSLFVAMAAFAFFFYAQMSIGDFKQMAYILPALPAVEVVAGVGLVWGVGWLAGRGGWSETAVAVILLGLMGLHVALVWPAYPLFGTYHNALLGGTETAVKWIPIQEQAEGIDAALDYIKYLDYSDNATIAVNSRMTSFTQRWYSACYRTEEPTTTAFRIYDVNSLLRDNMSGGWLQQWQIDQQTAPLFQANYDGVTYAWVYGDMPAVTTDEPLVGLYRFGQTIRLAAGGVENESLRPGDDLNVHLTWAVDDWICHDYKVFVHVYDGAGMLVAQQDVQPLHGARPTWVWRPGESLEDVVTVRLPPELAAGTYEVALGLYDSVSLARLPVTAGGEGAGGDTAVLTTITIVR